MVDARAHCVTALIQSSQFRQHVLVGGPHLEAVHTATACMYRTVARRSTGSGPTAVCLQQCSNHHSHPQIDTELTHGDVDCLASVFQPAGFELSVLEEGSNPSLICLFNSNPAAKCPTSDQPGVMSSPAIMLFILTVVCHKVPDCQLHFRITTALVFGCHFQ